MKPLALGMRKVAHGLAAGVLAALSAAPAQAGSYEVAEIPLFLGGVVEPNLVFMIDDSGSMAWSFVPDAIEGDWCLTRNSFGTCTSANGQGRPRALASRWNGLAYDPRIEYAPPYRGDTTTRFADSPFTAAWDDGYAHEYGDGSCPNETVDLSNASTPSGGSRGYRPTWYYADSRGQRSCDDTNDRNDGDLPEYWGGTSSTRPAGAYAFYYVHWWDHPVEASRVNPPGCDATLPTATTPDDDADDDECYVRVVVAGGTNGIATYGRTAAEEQQNFANWYSYYRKRTLAAKAGIGNAFSQLGSRFRVGFGRINSGTTSVDGVDTGGVIRGVRLFSGDPREQFFDDLYRTAATGSTPLRRAANNVGQYYSRTDKRNPWVDDPGDTTPPSNAAATAIECRKSFQLLMSDGYWNESFSAVGNQDGSGSTSWTGEIPSPADSSTTVSVTGGYTPTPGSPFYDSNSNTLADVAMRYWKNDLQPDVPNEVRPVYGITGATYATSFAAPNRLVKQPRNPAFWQHLTTYTIAFGLVESGNVVHVDPCCAFKDIANERAPECTTAVLDACPSPLVWPTPGADREENVDDMLHAAVNSRGGFLNARDPQGLESGIIGILEGIVPEDSTAASVALNSGVVRTGSLLYQALFTTDNWQGELRALEIVNAPGDPADGTIGEEVWSTTDTGKIPAWNSRRIVTHNGTDAVPFRWADLSTSQKQAIELIRAGKDSSKVLEFLRGDSTCENRNAAANGAACLYTERTCVRRCTFWFFGTCLSWRDECTTTSNAVAFRDRDQPHGDYVLGDITNSAPAYVGTPAGVYGQFDITYSDFKWAKNGDGDSPRRIPMVYAGANDGMLHAFDARATGGNEVFAYVPSMVVKNLSLLSSRAYSHRYYVDGSPMVRDWCQEHNADNPAVCASVNDWRTALVGGLGAGGQGVYALDVTDVPAAGATEASIASKVLWEFSDRNTASSGELPNGDRDLGYTYSQPSVVRMRDGHWYAVFGNGYDNTERDDPDGADADTTRACGASVQSSADDDADDGACDNVSTTGNAVLYFVRLGGSETSKNGRLVRKIDTGVGLCADPTVGAVSAPCVSTEGTRKPNGLSTPVVVDIDNDFKADYVYAGDLFGNLWKFDVSCANPNGISGVCPAWDVAYKDGTTKLPVVRVEDDATGLQPITSRPEVIRHPSGNGLMVVFGTGKYFESGDNRTGGQVTQSAYGIWDRPTVPPTTSRRITRSHLLEQTIDYEQGGYRITSANAMNWFFTPLCTGSLSPPACDADGLPSTGEGKLGWFMDLDAPTTGSNRGERQVSDMLIRADKVLFTTLLPLDDVCGFGGDSWLMEVDVLSGSRLSYATFDINGDGLFTIADLIDHDSDPSPGSPRIPPSGKKSEVGILPTPALIGLGGDLFEKAASGSKGGRPIVILNTERLGRKSWQQLIR
jgi:type IV pilus assembly protein PilY1